MSSILKVQNIQYTDGDAALTIADGGIVTGHNTLNVSHGTTGNSVGTFINTTTNSNTNGVVHVKQSAGTNQPTMVIEQTGTGGNPSDTQGLHIKIAGQNQGTGKAIRVTTTNASLNSGSAYDAFTVTNGGELSVVSNAGTTSLNLNQDGRLTIPKQPRFSARMNGSGYSTNSQSWTTMVFDNTLVNNGSHYDTSNGRFTAPIAGDYHFSTHVLQMSSSPSYGMLKWLKNGSTNFTGNKCYSTTYDSWMSLSIILSLATDDYVQVQCYNRFNKADYGSFQGMLLG